MGKRVCSEFSSGFGDLSDTIAAIATPLGQGGLGVVRISGSGAFPIADQIFRGRIIPSMAPSHTIHHGLIFDPRSGRDVDEALLLLMRSPRSYTTEDTVEISCHGGAYILRRVLQLLVDHGARVARPGEFTMRAFLHGRLDLAQAEAVIDLISASSERSLEVALDQLEGRLSQEVSTIKSKLVALLVQIEAAIDFPEDDLEFIDDRTLIALMENMGDSLRKLEDTYSRGRMVREGARAVIVGRPNVGKSSLLNALLGVERAIVTPFPGTTRDTIEGLIDVEGVAVRLIDTAGLRLARDPMEEQSIARARNEVDRADIVLFVIDASKGVNREDRDIWRKVSGRRVILVKNKIDLLPRIGLDEPIFDNGVRAVNVSATQCWGLDLLQETISSELLGSSHATTEEVVVTSLRHHDALKRAATSLNEARDSLVKGIGGEFVAIDVRMALDALGEIVGETATEEVLDRIFAQFCVGK